MLILVLLGVCFDAVVVFVTSQTLLFRLALAILWYFYHNRDVFSTGVMGALAPAILKIGLKVS